MKNSDFLEKKGGWRGVAPTHSIEQGLSYNPTNAVFPDQLIFWGLFKICVFLKKWLTGATRDGGEKFISIIILIYDSNYVPKCEHGHCNS